VLGLSGFDRSRYLFVLDEQQGVAFARRSRVDAHTGTVLGAAVGVVVVDIGVFAPRDHGPV